MSGCLRVSIPLRSPIGACPCLTQNFVRGRVQALVCRGTAGHVRQKRDFLVDHRYLLHWTLVRTYVLPLLSIYIASAVMHHMITSACLSSCTCQLQIIIKVVYCYVEMTIEIICLLRRKELNDFIHVRWAHTTTLGLVMACLWVASSVSGRISICKSG